MPLNNETLRSGMSLTVEPSIYFIKNLIEKLKDSEDSELIDWEKVESYFEIGGVRIEDVVVVKKGGCEILTCCPRTVEEIEKCMRGLRWISKDKEK